MRFIGDIHGNIGAWRQLIKGCDESIQVGDFGAGFVDMPSEKKHSLNHKFIRGNHDDPAICKASSRWIPDGTFIEKYRMMLIGGAWSIDHNMRTAGVDWWPDEQLSYVEMKEMIDKYERLKPEVMVTHDCPASIYDYGFKYNVGNQLTPAAFQAMLEIHSPKLWIFGHHHKHINLVYGQTRFVCLAINQTADVELTDFSPYNKAAIQEK